MISEVASKVESVAGAEVLVADSIHVIHVTGACDVDFALANQFLVLIFIVSSPGLDRGGALAMVRWQSNVCVVVFVVACCHVMCAQAPPMPQSRVMYVACT